MNGDEPILPLQLQSKSCSANATDFSLLSVKPNLLQVKAKTPFSSDLGLIPYRYRRAFLAGKGQTVVVVITVPQSENPVLGTILAPWALIIPGLTQQQSPDQTLSDLQRPP